MTHRRRTSQSAAARRRVDPTARRASVAKQSTFHRIAPLAVLFIAACLAFVNADHEDYQFDSVRSMNAPRTHDLGLTVNRLFGKPFMPSARFTYFTFALNYTTNAWFGLDDDDITSLLIVNVLIHAMNTCLVFILIRRLLQYIAPAQGPPSIWATFAPALLFAVHPLQTASVVYVIQRRGMLVAFFSLLTFLAYLRARTAPTRQGKIAWGGLIVVLVWLCMHSKTQGLTLPFALLALEFCLRAHAQARLRKTLGWFAIGIILCLFAVFGFLWATGLFDPADLEIKAWSEAPLWNVWTHFLTESRAFTHYWRLILLPLPGGLSIHHELPLSRSLGEHLAWLAVLFHTVMLGVAVWAAVFRRRLLASFGILLFYIALIPYILLPQIELLVEYKTYIPMIGVCLLAAEGLSHIRRRVPILAQAIPVTAIAIVLLVITLQRNPVFKDTVGFWQAVLRVHPDSARAYVNLGTALTEQGKLDEAAEAYEHAIQLAPDNYIAQYHVGCARKRAGDLDGAIQHFEKAIEEFAAWKVAMREFDPNTEPPYGYLEAHVNLGTSYAEQGRLDDAIKQFEEATKSKTFHGPVHPGRGKAWALLGNAMQKKDRFSEAIDAYVASLRFRPDVASVHYNCGRAFQRLGARDKAIKQYREALRIQPDYPAADAALRSILATNTP